MVHLNIDLSLIIDLILQKNEKPLLINTFATLRKN